MVKGSHQSTDGNRSRLVFLLVLFGTLLIPLTTIVNEYLVFLVIGNVILYVLLILLGEFWSK
jgi:hypothetical protein